MKKGKGKNKIVIASFMIAATILLITAGILYCYPYLDGYQHQAEEESIALRYLEELQEKVAGDMEGPIWEAGQLIGEEGQTEKRWSDDTYYEKDGVTYTPDYAAGTLDCVLIIPEIELCRGVYTGTWTEIYHNLDVWMATTARPDYVLGETHYCIYGHNTPRLNLSFNRLQSLSVGSIFYLINEDGAYQYQVTAILGISRSDSTKYTDDFSIDNDKCYIITCGRNEYRYLDLIVEGSLESVKNIDEINLDDLLL